MAWEPGSQLGIQTARPDGLPEDMPPEDCAPQRPEFLHMDDHRLISRASQRPQPDAPMRSITWDIQLRGNDISVRADLHRPCEMRGVDFREVKRRINEVLLSEYLAASFEDIHPARLRRSLYWQRALDDGSSHLEPPTYDEEDSWWLFSIESSGKKLPLDGPVIRPASNQMLLERREERQWAAYARQRLEWSRKLSLDSDLSESLLGSGKICRLRLLHYWQIPECRELFISSKSFATLFCMPGLLPELDDTGDNAWQETVTRLARLPRREWMERIGLPPTRQAVRLFARIKPWVIAPHLPLIRQAFANPTALKRLSDTDCAIDDMMLRLCQHETFPLHWPLFRHLCRDRKNPDFALNSIWRIFEFFPDDPFGQRIRRLYRRARRVEDLTKANRTANWLRMHWHGLFQPGVQDGLRNLTAPLPETESIRLLNRPQDLLSISFANDLCLEQYLHPITQGQYALYQVRHQGEFAVAGLRRSENGHWEIDQIRGKGNATPSKVLTESVNAWHANLRECGRPAPYE
jgi:hypothetical protein